MRRLVVFNQISLDGFFVDRNGDMSWAKAGNDEEFNAFTTENARGGGTLIFGRVTYELMAGFWPTAQAHELFPVVAERMNNLLKVVFSRTLKKLTWNNARLAKDDLLAEIQTMKAESGPGMVIMGSGTIVSQLSTHGLIDEYQIVQIPIVLGRGRTMFDGLDQRLRMKLVNSRTFRNGKVFLSYEPA
jgi:dihydrofolate reductase